MCVNRDSVRIHIYIYKYIFQYCTVKDSTPAVFQCSHFRVGLQHVLGTCELLYTITMSDSTGRSCYNNLVKNETKLFLHSLLKAHISNEGTVEVCFCFFVKMGLFLAAHHQFGEGVITHGGYVQILLFSVALATDLNAFSIGLPI